MSTPSDALDSDQRTRRARAALDAAAPAAYRDAAALIAASLSLGPTARAGLGGGQGAGKSSLARMIERAGQAIGLRIISISLDDFYLTRAERSRLAERVHPLLETRGPPGTHDMGLLADVLEALSRPRSVALPVFDKGIDDRAPTARWLTGPFDVVLLEGWCVGARPTTPERLAEPVNALERDEDADGTWRGFVNEALAGPYAELWRELGWLAFLAVPDLDAVRRWRAEQEAERPPAQRLGPAEIDRFVQHYERVTRDMLDDLPDRADLTIRLTPAHTVAELRPGRDRMPAA